MARLLQLDLLSLETTRGIWYRALQSPCFYFLLSTAYRDLL